MPGNRLPFAVLIGRQPDIFFANGFDGLFQFGDDFLFLGVNFVLSVKIVLNINRWCAVLSFDDRADMPNVST